MKAIKRITLLQTFIVACIMHACVPSTSIESTKPKSMCEMACANLNKHRCVDGKPIQFDLPCDKCNHGQTCNVETKKCETSCVQFCEDLTAQRIDLDLSCVASATTCTAAKQCNE